jgi:hypothetical protein
MNEIKVITENYPTRCEICHQSDLFDKTSNYCARCNPLAKRLKNNSLIEPKKNIISEAIFSMRYPCLYFCYKCSAVYIMINTRDYGKSLEWIVSVIEFLFLILGIIVLYKAFYKMGDHETYNDDKPNIKFPKIKQGTGMVLFFSFLFLLLTIILNTFSLLMIISYE